MENITENVLPSSEIIKSTIQTITAIEDYDVNQSNVNKDIRIFLAGGICNCSEWQSEVINYLSIKANSNSITSQDNDNDNHSQKHKLVLFNPRRPDFPIGDINESNKQIEWEFKWLSEMNIFTMFFDDSISVQPICFYELGRYLLLMTIKYPKDYQHRIVISYKKGFSRWKDVDIQTSLATQGLVKAFECNTSIEHADKIYDAYNTIIATCISSI